MSRLRQPGRVVRAAGRRLPRRPFRILMPIWVWRPLSRLWLSALRADPDRRRAVRELLVTYEDVYREVDLAAIAYEGGVHPKHRLTRYHDFFVERVRRAERIADLGCGSGLLAASIAGRAGGQVAAMDWSESSLEKARRVAGADNPSFTLGNITTDRLPGRFDAVVLSNVLEHLTDRPALLRQWRDWYEPQRFLIRVPALDREWRAPWKKELGVEWRLDLTHETEYTQPQLEQELREAGLRIKELIARWGEYWAVAGVA